MGVCVKKCFHPHHRLFVIAGRFDCCISKDAWCPVGLLCLWLGMGSSMRNRFFCEAHKSIVCCRQDNYTQSTWAQILRVGVRAAEEDLVKETKLFHRERLVVTAVATKSDTSVLTRLVDTPFDEQFFSIKSHERKITEQQNGSYYCCISFLIR